MSVPHDKGRGKRAQRAADQKRQRTAEKVARGMAAANRYRSRRVETDNLFFTEHREREYYIRAPLLGDMYGLAPNAPVTPPAGFQYIAAVRRISPGHHVTRIFVGSGALEDVPDDEDTARMLWWMGASPADLTGRLAQLAAQHLHSGVLFGRGRGEKAPPNAGLCMRLPIGRDGYRSETAAVEALESFGARLAADVPALERPAAVGPGDAVWAVWSFREPVPAAAWAEMADHLGQLAASRGLKLDGPVIDDPPFDIAFLVPGRLEEFSL